MRSCLFVVILAAFSLSASAWAKPKARTFKESCKKVFPVAEKLASHKPYKMYQDNKADMSLTFETGSWWKAGAQTIYVQMKSEKNGSCTVTDNARYSGFRRNGTVFLHRLEKALVETKKKDSK